MGIQQIIKWSGRVARNDPRSRTMGTPDPEAPKAPPPPPPPSEPPHLKRTPVEYLSEAVQKQFKVRHIEGDRFRIAFFTRETAAGAPVKSDSLEVDAAFEALRVDLKQFSFVPTLQIAGEDGVVTVSRIVDPEFRSSRVNWAFFLLTLISVQTAGAGLWSGYVSPHGPTGNEPQLDWLSADAMLNGFLFFTVPLLSILGLHEMGHFITARHYKVRASLPFFIPSVPPLGTFGAFISMRDPLPSRRVIFDIGLSGPLVGFVASIAVTAAGAIFMASNPQAPRPEVGNGINLGVPMMFDAVMRLVGEGQDSYMHPTLFAGWAGFLVTAFNLIPAAQLDGGHVMFSLLRNGAKRQSRAVAVSAFAVLGIAVLGSLLGYSGWLLLIIIVFLTIRHPPPLNQVSSLDWKRFVAGALAILVFAVSFSPAPLTLIDADYSFEVSSPALALVVPAGGSAIASFNVTNMGNTFNSLKVEVKGSAGPFTATFAGSNTSTHVLTNRLEFIEQTVNVTIESLTLLPREQGAVYLVVSADGDASLQTPIVIYAITGPAHPSLEIHAPENTSAAPGSNAFVPLEVRNTGDVALNISLNATGANATWPQLKYGYEVLDDYVMTFALDPGKNATVQCIVEVPGAAGQGAFALFTIEAVAANWTEARASVTFRVTAGA